MDCSKIQPKIVSFPNSRNNGLYDNFLKQVERVPNRYAVVENEKTITYENLHRIALNMAHNLKTFGIQHETLVGILLNQRIEYIAAELAISMLGGTCIPLNPEYTEDYLLKLIHEFDITTIISDQDVYLKIEKDFILNINKLTSVDYNSSKEEYGYNFIQKSDSRAFILFTSGSTGKPKGVEILVKNITNLVCNNILKYDDHEKVTQIANFGFDASLLEIWGALLNGGTLYLIPKSTALNPAELEIALTQYEISMLFLPTALFNLLAQFSPDIFKSVKYLIVGGERENVRLMQKVVENGAPQHFLHVYGPTEATVFVTSLEVTPCELTGKTVAIGRPIGNAQVLILNREKEPVRLGHIGEIFIAGECLSRGYFRLPELTAERFVIRNGKRLYKTGDLGKWREDGSIVFMGRSDNQVKISGYRIELDEIESYILQTGVVSDVVLTVYPNMEHAKFLVAHVVPINQPDQILQTLRNYLHKHLPPYMIPARFVFHKTLPLNVNDKIDRALLNLNLENKQFSSICMPTDDAFSVMISKFWQSCLGLSHIDFSDNFFELGGTSLSAVEVCLLLSKRLDIHIPTKVLYETPTFKDFSNSLKLLEIGMINLYSTDLDWLDDVNLADSLSNNNNDYGVPLLTKIRNGFQKVFVTGVTGFLGVHFLHDLLLENKVIVLCLVRAQNVSHGHHRIQTAMKKYGLWKSKFTWRIEPIVGDLYKIRFGLTEKDFHNLANISGKIYHIAAHVNYAEPYQYHRSINVIGTLEILRLTATGIKKPLHFISSICVFGPAAFIQNKNKVLEDDSLQMYADSMKYEIGYSKSKWVSEMLLETGKKKGLDITIYRPGFIIGSSRGGISNYDDFIGRIVRGCVQIGAYPNFDKLCHHIITVDFVSQAILQFSKLLECAGKIYHLVPLDSTVLLCFNDFMRNIEDKSFPMTKLSYEEWLKLLQADTKLSSNPLLPVLGLFSDRVYKESKTFWELHNEHQEYDMTNTKDAMKHTSVTFSPFTEELVAVYVTGITPLIRK